MTKLLCPLCHQTHFGVRTTHQAHVNAHLFAKHNILVSAANQAHWRQRQDTVWSERDDRLQKEWKQAHLRHRQRLNKLMAKGLLPVDEEGEGVLEALKLAIGVWNDVDEDEDARGVEPVGGRAGVEREIPAGDFAGAEDVVQERERERKDGVSASLRHYQVGEGRVRAWQQRRKLMGRMREATHHKNDKRAPAARGRGNGRAVEVDLPDDQEIEEIRERATRALEYVKENLAHARAGKKRMLRRKVVRMMAEDAAERMNEME